MKVAPPPDDPEPPAEEPPAEPAPPVKEPPEPSEESPVKDPPGQRKPPMKEPPAKKPPVKAMAATLTAATVLSLAGLTAATAQEAAAPPRDRAETIRLLADMRRIGSPQAVERLEAVRIGGIDQWISVRGVDRRNPILLFIHGGPGYAAMPTSWYFQRGWEDYFTVVQWDQRGAGKTYAANDPDAVGPTMTVPRMIADAEEMIGWLRREFGKKKIFVLGHSWGSLVGLTIAQRHPEWLHAYIGMGQLIDGPESERRGWRFALDRARQASNEEAVRELEAIAPYPKSRDGLTVEDVYVQRKWLAFYGGAIVGRTGYEEDAAAVALAPEYSDADVRSFEPGVEFSHRLLPDVLLADLTKVTALACPLILFNGRHDYNVSATVAAEWFGKVRAPSKTLVWFERSAHMMMSEEPGRFLVALVENVRAIAERAGDIAPR